MSLNGVHALITGGGGGIGAAIAVRLHAMGCYLTLVGRNAERLEASAARFGRDAIAAPADITDHDALEAAWAKGKARYGDPAVLINNAGAAVSAPLLKTSRADLERMLAVNLTSAFHASQLALPWMTECGFGRIVNVASTAGLRGYAYVTAYSAAKHALVGLTRSLALEVAAKGVTVNAVCPGFVETEMTVETIERIMAKTGRDEAAARAELAKENPQGRLITAGEVADSVAFLCSREASGVNGAVLTVSGGHA